MTSVVGLLLLPTRITLYLSIKGFRLFISLLPLLIKPPTMAGLFDVLFRGLTGLDRNAQTIDSTKEVSVRWLYTVSGAVLMNAD